MSHTVEEYYRERARFERRLALVVACVSLVSLGAESSCLVPFVRHSLFARFVESLQNGPLSPKRFGFEGPEQYVRRIILESSGPPGPNPGHTQIVYRSLGAVKGGRPNSKPSNDPHARPDTRRIGVGKGESTADLVAQARVIYGGTGTEVMRSEDLIIDRLVTPEYPEEARDRNIEGRVALVALVDTLGGVTRVDLMSSTGERLLEDAAKIAVGKCRFRPYLQNGKPSEVYAVFRFSFKMY
ncbi:MAG TPA: energy transducer TonB [Terriglobales bacterium]|nr:energy transducer TonB [Terriglobales bacterium]